MTVSQHAGCILFFLALAGLLGAQSPPPLSVARGTGPIVLDGRSDEPAWKNAAAWPFVQIEPNAGAAPTERTEILVLHDERFLYIAGRLYDREPGLIRANSKARDSDDGSSDWWGVVVDSFNDKENALAFFTTPAGLRWDAAVFDDARGERPINPTWNTFWDVAVVRNGEGWFAEMRIPFSSLRFQPKDGRVVMGFISWRSISRKNEWVVFPSIPPNWGFWGKFKPSRAREIVLEGVRPLKPLFAAPYLVGGYGREPDPGRPPSERWEREAGLDLKLMPTSNLTLDLTLNPDFAQVEADDAQINLTRYSLFFPEKRLFFQERASIFEFVFEGTDPNRLFYSRRIGISGGRLVRLYGGARLVGRLGGWDIGLLDMQSAAAGADPAGNDGVFRLRRRVFNPFSYVGAIVTSRLEAGGRFNTAYGLDGVIRVFGDDYLTLKWAQSFASGAANDPFSLAPTRFHVQWKRQSFDGLGYGLGLSRGGADFDPALGFELRKDFSRASAMLWYGWLPGEKSSLSAHHVFLDSVFFGRNAGRTLESGAVNAGWVLYGKSGLNGWVGTAFSFEDVPAEFRLSKTAAVPAGRYRFFSLHGELETPSGKDFSLVAEAEAGSFYDGTRVTVRMAPVWSPAPDLNLAGTFETSRVRFPTRGQSWTAYVAGLRILWTLSREFSAAAFLQYEGDSGAAAANVRLRYNPREGVDLYLVYNETLNTGTAGPGFARSGFGGRAIMLKATYTFRIGG